MNFLVDTNICSAYLKGDRRVWGKFMQYSGGLAISVVTAGELWTCVARSGVSEGFKKSVADLLTVTDVVDIDLRTAIPFRELRGQMLDSGTPCPDMDTLIAAKVLLEDLTLVTHNLSDFQAIPGLRIENWLEG